MEQTPSKLPTYFLSHGGGPWPWMMDQVGDTYRVLDASLKDMARQLGDLPKALLVVTAHWEERVFTVSTAAQPGMIYDYGGFPPHTYQITYPAPGLPELGERAAQMLADGGMASATDPTRGFDHGTFSVLQALWPAAHIPVVQMSIRRDFDPAAHLQAGRLLAPLRDEGVLIIGSGLSFHNLRAMGHPAAGAPSHAFDSWLQDSLVHQPADVRAQRLIDWEQAPAARLVQPREDHLLPLHVAVGAAGRDAGHLTYHEDDFFGNLAASSFQFGELVAH